MTTIETSEDASLLARRQTTFRKTNLGVAQAFLARREFWVSNLYTDGTTLRSYRWYDLAQWEGDVIVLRKGPLYSMTTKSKHWNALLKAIGQTGVKWRFSETETPCQQGRMEVQ